MVRAVKIITLKLLFFVKLLFHVKECIKMLQNLLNYKIFDMTQSMNGNYCDTICYVYRIL